jgi:hypothetical protein
MSIAKPSTDDVTGMAWFNGLSEQCRLMWLLRAGSDVPPDAWSRTRGRSDSQIERDVVSGKLYQCSPGLQWQRSPPNTYTRCVPRREGRETERELETFSNAVAVIQGRSVLSFQYFQSPPGPRELRPERLTTTTVGGHHGHP